MTKYLFIFTSFMIDGDILHKSKNYFSFHSEEQCRFVEFKTLNKNDPQNCLLMFTPFSGNKTEEISKGLASRSDV